MAEIIIPAVALGAMYIVSNQKKEKTIEKFENPRMSVPEGMLPTGMPTKPTQNYPVQKYRQLSSNNAFYSNPNSATDKYYRQDVYEEKVENKEDPGNLLTFQSLTGNAVQKKDIKFNNMVPFFGAKITQRTFDYGRGQSVLDNMAGTGKQRIRKKAQAPLFKPVANMHYANGAPNRSDFMQSRVNPSRRVSGNKPYTEQQVGPGMNKGFTSAGSGGFNSGMEARKEWLPKTVDQLRATTNPKVTFGLGNHEGPANSIIKRPGLEGRIEKNRPDTYYFNSPERWFTTTGQEKAQRARSEEPLQPENRPFTTREYFGAGGGEVNGGSAQKARAHHNPSTKVVLDGPDKYPGAAHNLNYATGWKNLQYNYGKDGFVSRPNARSTTRQPEEFGIVGGWMKAAMAPVMDILRPSRKENVVGNMRPTGNAGGAYGVNQARVWNPSDRPKTTIKEQTAANQYDAAPDAPYNIARGAYTTTDHQPVENQRDTTNCQVMGGAGATPWSTAGPVYNAAYNAHLNPNREVVSRSRPNQGGMSILNSNVNIKSSKIGNMHPCQGPINMPKQTGNISSYGKIGYKNNRDSTIELQRTEGSMLNAFKQNPYTHSLESVA
jgi:hypothetical protein